MTAPRTKRHTMTNTQSKDYDSLFEEIYTNYYGKVLSYLTGKVSDRNVAEDLAGDVFLRCYKNIQKFDASKGSESTWVFTITKNLLKNYYRDRKVTASIDNMEGFDVADEQDVEEEIAQALRLEEIREFLDREIAKLDSVKRQILLMRYYDEMSSNEIAQIMNMTPGNVRVILTRTLNKLRIGAEDDVVKLGI